jgi:carbon-monoxide dehydrogenase medium subunit
VVEEMPGNSNMTGNGPAAGEELKLHAFEYFRATSIDEAVSRLLDGGDKIQILSGGTDLLVKMREGRCQPRLLLDIKAIPEVNQLTFEPDTGLRLGAAVPCIKIRNDPAVASLYPGIVDAVSLIGGIQIQGRATVGGNLCMASPSADAVPALIVHKAVCTVAGPRGIRRVPVESFCIAPGRTILKQGEFLVTLQLPAPKPRSGASYLRFTPRNEMDIAVTGAAAYVQLTEDLEEVKEARIALATSAPVALLATAAGNSLIGKSPDDEVFAKAAELAQECAIPRSSMRGTRAQRRHLIGVLVKRGLLIATDRARRAGSRSEEQ